MSTTNASAIPSAAESARIPHSMGRTPGTAGIEMGSMRIAPTATESDMSPSPPALLPILAASSV